MSLGKSNVTLQASASPVTCPGGHVRIDSKTHAVTLEERPPVAIPVTTIKIDDIAFAAVGGDVGSKIGQEIRASSPAEHTVVVVTQLAGAIGYILADDSYEHPGHGVAGSPLKAGCVERALPEAIAGLLGFHSN